MGFLHDLYRERGQAVAEQASHTIIRDKGAYLSPMDRKVVEGRTAHREHMKSHGVLEAGDMKLGEASRDTNPIGVRQDINRVIQELSSR